MAEITEQQFLGANPELQDVSRQRRLAELLMAQGMQQPQGQMVSGYYVAPSWTQQLNPIANILAGQAVGERADTEQAKLAQALKQRQIAEAENIMSAGSQEERISAALRGNSPLSRTLAPKLLETYTKEPNWERTEINVNDKIIKGVYDKRNPDVMATFRPYNESYDVPLAGAKYSGIIRDGTQNAPMGNQNAPQGGSNFVNQAQSLGLPIISGVRTPLQQAELRHHKDPMTGQWMTKENRPVSENSAHLSGNAIDLKPNAPLNAAQQSWLAQNAYQPNPTKDANHWEIKSGVSSKMPEATAFANTKYDLEVPKQFNTPKERDEWFAKSREPLTGEPLKMTTGAETTIFALRDFNKGLQNFKKADLVNPDKSAEMNGLAKNAILALKDAKGLGVLNKEDLPQLEAILRNPSDWKNILNSKELFQKLADRQIEFASKVIATNYKKSYKDIPESTKRDLIQIDAEVADRQKADVLKTLDKPLMYQSPDAVEAAGKAGRIKDGQLIIIGNQKFRYKKD